VLPYAGRGLEALTALRLLGVEEPSPGAWQPAARPEPGFAPRAPSEQDPGLPLAGRLCGLTALRELALGASDLIGAAITSDLCTLTHLTLLEAPLHVAGALPPSLGALRELHVRVPGGSEAEGQVLLLWCSAESKICQCHYFACVMRFNLVAVLSPAVLLQHVHVSGWPLLRSAACACDPAASVTGQPAAHRCFQNQWLARSSVGCSD
jgi:hypothetical protein